MKCPIDGVEFEKAGRKIFCSEGCKQKAKRLKLEEPKGTLVTPDGEVVGATEYGQPIDEKGWYHAVLSTEGSPGAVRRVAGAEVTWVIPGRCKHGLCLMVKQH